jgi:hypothetical protein
MRTGEDVFAVFAFVFISNILCFQNICSSKGNWLDNRQEKQMHSKVKKGHPQFTPNFCTFKYPTIPKVWESGSIVNDLSTHKHLVVFTDTKTNSGAVSWAAWAE